MCVYSMIADHYKDKWVPEPYVVPPLPSLPPLSPPWMIPPFPAPVEPAPTAEEIRRFREDAEELKRLLERAKKYDAANGEPECELEEKKAVLREIAKKFGVEIEFP